MLLPALTVMSALSGLVLWGSSTCPSPREGASRLPKNGAAKLQVELRAGNPVEVVLRDDTGRLVATRVLPSAGPCDALAAEAAREAGVRIAGWEGRFAPFVRLAVDATLVSSGQLMTLPVALNLGAGIGWSGA